MPFKKVTLKEWKSMGLPVEISTIYLGGPGLKEKYGKKIKSNSKIYKQKEQIK